MKDKTFLLIFLFVVTKCLCQNTNGCTNIDTDQIDWTAGLFQQFINDNEILNLNFSYTGNLEINFPESSESGTKYLNVIKSGDQVIFQTTDEFSKLEEDEEAPAPSGNQILLSRTVNFTCDGGTAKIAFILFVSDTNNHDPAFDKDTYSYEIPNPIPPKIDLTGFGNQITVTDFDFTNTDVSFTIDSKDFETSTTKLDSFRKYDLVLKAKQYKYLSEDTTLTLTATDSGTPPRSKTAQIQIKIDKDTSLPDIPTVPEVSYEFDYSLDTDGKPVLKPLGADIVVTTSDVEKTTVKLEGDFASSFDATFDKTSKVVTISTKDTPIDNSPKPVLVLTLVITLNDKTEDSSKTVILINLPKDKVIGIPQFNLPYYTAQYTANPDPNIDSVKLDTEISLSEEADVTLEGDLADHFSIDEKKQIQVVTDLDEDIIKEGEEILLILHAKVTQDETVYEGFATLVVQFPEAGEAPKFTKPYYSANYVLSTDGSLDTLDMSETIALISPNSKVEVKLVDSHSDHFNVAVNDDKTGYDLKLVKNLDHTVLISEADVVLTLQATIDDSVGEASLVVKLPKTTPPARFTKGYYLADYNMDSDKHKLVMKDNIELEGDFLAETEVVLEVDDELEEYFTFTPNPPTITLNNNLDEKILAEEHEVILGLSATLDKVSVRSTVVIAIPDLPTAPNFIKVTYTGSYDKENLAVKLDDDLETDAKDPTSVEITVEDPYVSNFDVKYNSTAKCYTVKVLNPLDDDTVDKEDEIYVALDATVDRAVTHSSATLVLKMPKKTSDIVPKFSEAHYRATYYENKSVVVTTPIVITSDQADSTEINVVKDYVDNFKMAKDGTTWGITVLKELDTTSDKEIVLTLEASLSGSTEKSEATLIMDLPNQELKPTPRFTKAYYEAEYKDETVNVTSDQITIPSAEKEIVEVTLDDTYKDYFGVSRNKNNKTQWDLDVVKPLDNNILDENTELILTLTSHLDHSESDDVATLLIKLPEHEEEFITFDKAYYSATYKVVDKDTDTVDSPKITVSSGATVSVIKDYAENFQVDNCKDNKCILTVKTDLSEEVLNTRNEVIVVLQATKTGIAEKITAPVVVTLPLQETIEAPQFNNIAYSADYNSDDNTVSDNTIKVKETDISQIDVTIDSSSEYKDNFAIEQVNDHWRVKVKKALDIKDQVSVSLILQATKIGVSVSGHAVFVVNLPAKQDSTVVKFSEVTYSGHYTVKDSLDEVTIDQTIKIEGITDVSQADVVIEPNTAEDLSTYFEVKPETDHWTLNVIKDLPSNILDEEVSILLTLKATLKETNLSGEVGVVITLPKKVTPTSFYFDGTVYNAEYKNDDKPSIKVDSDITIKEDADYGAQVSLTGENSDYFSSSYSKGKVSITLKKALPDDTVKDKSANSLVIVAKKKDEEAKATLVVQLPKEKGSGGDDDDSSNDQTGLIAAVAVLAVLLVAAIVGSGVFYYFKFRAAKNYNNTTTESPRPSERFRKNSNGIESKNKFEHPTRRPTGVIKYPLVDVSTEEEAEVTPIDKRKSVQFDVVHIDELEIESEKPDDDENDSTYENVEADRRNSEA